MEPVPGSKQTYVQYEESARGGGESVETKEIFELKYGANYAHSSTNNAHTSINMNSISEL